jgi:hypothetical protein
VRAVRNLGAAERERNVRVANQSVAVIKSSKDERTYATPLAGDVVRGNYASARATTRQEKGLLAFILLLLRQRGLLAHGVCQLQLDGVW